MRLFACLILSISLQSIAFAGEPQAPIPLPEDSVKIEQAKLAIRQIWRQAQIYYQDRGNWPESVEELEKLNYIKFDSSITADWLFTMFKAYSSWRVGAQQCYLAKNANTVSLPDYHRITLDTETGEWHGSGVPSYKRGNLTKQQEADLVYDAQSAIIALMKATGAYYQDRGVEASVVDLVRGHYVVIPNSVKINWSIHNFGSDSIEAVSTQWMSDGEGKRFVYYPVTRTWSGYGIVDSHFEPMMMVPYIETSAPAGKKEIGQ